MQALNIIDCPAESHLLRFLMKVILKKVPATLALKLMVVFVEANMVYGCKTTTMKMMNAQTVMFLYSTKRVSTSTLLLGLLFVYKDCWHI